MNWDPNQILDFSFSRKITEALEMKHNDGQSQWEHTQEYNPDADSADDSGSEGSDNS